MTSVSATTIRGTPWCHGFFADNLSGLPSALIIAAEYDSLRDEAEASASKLQAAGVDVTYACYSGMIHGLLQTVGLALDAQRAVDQIAQFIIDQVSARPVTCGLPWP